jgi:putative membrane protein
MLKWKSKILWGIAIIYVVGIVGISFPQTRNRVLSLSPLNLVSSFGLILAYHRDWSWKFLIFVICVFVLSLVLEIVGVATGAVFGEYHYGDSLGPLLYGAPFVIGLNWVMLVYASHALFTFFTINRYLRILISAIILVVFDMAMEPVSHHLHMWYWPDNVVPPQNYLAWFIAALFFAWLGSFLQVNFKNMVARFVIVTQFLFFLVLNIVFRILEL